MSPKQFQTYYWEKIKIPVIRFEEIEEAILEKKK